MVVTEIEIEIEMIARLVVTATGALAQDLTSVVTAMVTIDEVTIDEVTNAVVAVAAGSAVTTMAPTGAIAIAGILGEMSLLLREGVSS